MARKKSESWSGCPIRFSMAIFGDKWTLLVVRDLFLGKCRYVAFQASPESIPTNILADRLKRLVQEGLVTKEAYQNNPKRFEYSLTKKGLDLDSIMRELVRWGEKHVEGTKAFEKFRR